jgi:hypothetical protein
LSSKKYDKNKIKIVKIKITIRGVSGIQSAHQRATVFTDSSLA